MDTIASWAKSSSELGQSYRSSYRTKLHDQETGSSTCASGRVGAIVGVADPVVGVVSGALSRSKPQVLFRARDLCRGSSVRIGFGDGFGGDRGSWPSMQRRSGSVSLIDRQ